MSAYSIFLWALFGGIFFELLHWYGLRKDPNFPVFFGSTKYWAITGLMVLSGAIFAVAVGLSGTSLTPLTAILFGYSAPSIIQKLAKSLPPPTLGGGGTSGPGAYAFLIG
jgi:hypothetical protein